MSLVMADDMDIFSDEENHDDSNSRSTHQQRRRRSAYHFKDTDDINLLKEVAVEKPVGKDGPKKWKAIFDRLGLPFKDYRALKRRFDHLLSCYKSNNLKALRGSGLEENYDEKMQLLTDISSQLEDWQKEDSDSTTTAKRKLEESQKRAQSIRDAALTTLEEPSPSDRPTADDTTPKRSKRFKPVDVLEILTKSEEKDKSHQEAMVEIEKKKLELRAQELANQAENDKHRREMETKKLELEEKRLEMENRRHEKDSEERALLLQLLSKQL